MSCTSARESVRSVTDLTKQITDAMMQYTGAVSEEIETALKSVGKEAKNRLRATSPKRSGEYRKSWTISVERRSGEINVIVHNKEHYRLIHLLEYGHKMRNGKKSRAISHVAHVEEWAEKEALKAVEKAVKG